MENNQELEMLARLLYGENRANMSPDEAAAIVRTVYERTGLEGFPSTPMEVMLQPRQYHPFTPQEGNTRQQTNAAKVEAFGPDHPRWMDYITLAQYGYQEALKPKAEAPTHYFTGPAPDWAKGMRLTQIGEHTFGRESRKRKTLGAKKPPKK